MNFFPLPHEQLADVFYEKYRRRGAEYSERPAGDDVGGPVDIQTILERPTAIAASTHTVMKSSRPTQERIAARRDTRPQSERPRRRRHALTESSDRRPRLDHGIQPDGRSGRSSSSNRRIKRLSRRKKRIAAERHFSRKARNMPPANGQHGHGCRSSRRAYSAEAATARPAPFELSGASKPGIWFAQRSKPAMNDAR